MVVIAGPDGTGKTTVLDGLVDGALRPKLLRLHHRPRVLGGRTHHDGPVTEPHRGAPYPPGASAVKILFLFVDHVLGWFVLIRPWLRAGGDVVLERGWWDLVVDPRRYRLRPNRPLVQVLGRCLPRPDITLVLGGDAGVIAARKAELSVAETRRQLASWEALAPHLLRSTRIDTCRPMADVRAAVDVAVNASRVPGPFVALPRRSAPRWYVPAAPARAAVNGLRLHNPVTPRGRAAWTVARALAARGGFRALSTHDGRPPATVLELLAPHVPPGGRVAVAHGNHPGRTTAILLDARGAPSLFAKVALDPGGPVSLAAEADAAERFSPLLPPGLYAPEIRHRGTNVLLFEAVSAIPRSRPWSLPGEVAFLLGRLHAAGRRPDGTGPAHGDCAPWNLMRTERGWYLVDWADARPDAPPFEDVLHFLVQAHALLGRPRRRELTAALLGRGGPRRVIERYAEGAGIDPARAVPAAIDYLVRSSATLDSEARDGRAGLRARGALLAALEAER